MQNNLQGGEIDYSEIPINALSHRSRVELALLLNPRKILLSENGYPRDWRGLADLAKLHKYNNMLATEKNPTLELLRIWNEEHPEDKVSKLQKFLGFIDRWDVLDDTRDVIKNDAVVFLQARCDQATQVEMIAVANAQQLLPPQLNPGSDESGIYTYDDIRRRHIGEENQKYDAFVLFAEDDAAFAMEMTERMEQDGDLKFCLKQRDLMPGTMEYEALTTLISDRCHRLIVILSPAFFESQAIQFYVNLAQATGINNRTRKVIPILYKPCQPPSNLKFFFCLKYGQDERMFNFWVKLKDSVKMYEVQPMKNTLKSNVVITDVTTPPQSLLAIEDKTASATASSSAAVLTVEKKSTKVPRDIPFMPPAPRLRSAQSMISLSTRSTAVSSSTCDINLPSEENLSPNSEKLSKASRFFKKFSSNFSLNSKEVMANGTSDGTLKKKKKKSDAKIAVAVAEVEEEGSVSGVKKNKTSRKFTKFLHSLVP